MFEPSGGNGQRAATGGNGGDGGLGAYGTVGAQFVPATSLLMATQRRGRWQRWYRK
ncbi:hypothetical protein ABLO15_06520 [Mycobacterium tuberculosis]